ncbi:MAG: M50 family metallopeptidase [Defluviitaleaceae bacterium]|nr:M50 family metallopeptidase [Defluviitaleaceae bacterium]
MSTITPILIFVFILGIVIFIHELGHFLAARRAGIFVEEFAMGMGPKIFSKNGKKQSHDGETTLYSLRAFPIGGFCKMRGMDDEMPDDAEAMNNKSIPARMLVMAGGSIMNFLLAFVLFFILVMLQGYRVIEIMDVDVNMPAYHAGLRAGDRITHIDGTRVDLQESLSAVLNAAGGEPINFRVNRDGSRYNIPIIPIENDGRHVIGITMSSAWNHQIGIFDGIVSAGEMIVFHIRSPFRLIARLIMGEPLPEGGAVMGPIGIGGVVAEVYLAAIEVSFFDMLLTMVFFTAFLNAAIGVMNFLPIPALDGARIIFLIIEAVRRKPVPPEKEAMVHFVGLVVLLVAAVFIAYQDIARIVT